MASRRVPLSREELATLQGGTKNIIILAMFGGGFVVSSLLLTVFQVFDLIINLLPLFPGFYLIGYAIKSYRDLQKDINYSYKDIITGNVEKLGIRYPSKFSGTKITYEFITPDRVKVSEVGPRSKTTSTFDIITDYWVNKKGYAFYVMIDNKEYKIPGMDFFALRKGDPIELEVLPSNEVLKVNRANSK